VIGEYLASVSEILNPFSDTPFLDASVLLANMLGKSRTWILAHPEAPIPLDQRQLVDNAILRLVAGEPLPYVISHWEFYGLDFQLNAATLIPRPETELLVEKALEWLKEHPGPCMAADVGTGSGCIAVALAHHMTDLQVIATDISAFALRAAKANAIRHNVASRIAFVQGNLMESIEASFDIIGANLPYIPTRTLHMLDVYKSEPELALDGGADGLNLIRSLLAQAPERLNRNGRLLVEIEMNQPAAATSMAKAVFPNSEVHVFPDLAGKDRLLVVDNIQTEIETS
jgi:release factor glutamine methyltransferase